MIFPGIGTARLRAAGILALALLGIPAAGCVTVIRPPSSPEDPVPVAVIDYGYHSSLLLPLPEGGSVEYAYGDWDWFALNRDEWYRACPTLCWPNPGALGRRRHAVPPSRPALQGVIPCEEILEVQVARSRAELLRKKLEESFEKNLETRVFNPQVQLEFVQGDIDYCFLVNCNHILARWLRELGCDLGGSACFSSFRVELP